MIETIALKEAVSAAAKELTVKELPNFAKEVTPVTESMEEANLPILNRIDYTAEGIEPVNSIKCINEHLAGEAHKVTGVPFQEKIVMDHNDVPVKVVVPEFDSAFDAKLPGDMLMSSDYDQIKECNSQLREAIQSEPGLKESFTDPQLEMIESDYTPKGYTWHHDAEKGSMQLVKTNDHLNTPHTGGRAIWGGGQGYR